VADERTEAGSGAEDLDAPIPDTPPRQKKRAAEPPPKKRGKLLPIGAAIAFLLVLGIVLVPWLLRHSIATSMAREQLTAAGLTCDERFAIEVAPFFGSASFQPTRCTSEGGQVESVELTEELEVELSGTSPTAIDATFIRVTLRDRDVAGGSSWDRNLARLNLEERVAGLVKAVGELSALPLPPTRVARVDVLRDGETITSLYEVELTPGEPMRVEFDRIAFRAVGGAAQLTLNDVEGTSTRSDVHLEGGATARASMFIGTVVRNGTFSLDATRLDQSRPRFTLETTLR
jgi:hypothetical protein